MIPKADVLLVDLSNLIWRGFHGYSSDNLPEEDPVSHMSGSLKLLISCMKKNPRSEIYFAVDGKFIIKKAENSSYKGTRTKTDYDIQMMQEAKDFLKLIPAFWCWNNEYEADDIVATFIQQQKREGLMIKIFSNDKDLMALVDDGKVSMIGLKGEEIDSAKVIERMGVPPCKVEIFKTFFGDVSDDIDGVSRVRKNSLIPVLLKKENAKDVYDFLDHCYGKKFDYAPNLTEKEYQHLFEYREQSVINEALVKLNRRVGYYEVEFDGKRLDLKERLYDMGFKSVIQDVDCLFWKDREKARGVSQPRKIKR